MAFNKVNYALANKYTDDTAIGFGGLQGANATVEGYSFDEEGNTTVTFKYTATDGTTKTTDVIVKRGEQGEIGDSGVYIGTTAPTDEKYNVWINISEAYEPDTPLTASDAEEIVDTYVQTHKDELKGEDGKDGEYAVRYNTQSSATQVALSANVFTMCETPLTDANITFNETDNLPLYSFGFVAGANCTLTFPSGIQWTEKITPSFVEGYTYEVSINALTKIAVCTGGI